MRRSAKWILIGVAMAVVIPAVAVGLLITVFGMALSGAWPFEPLDRRFREIHLADGSIIRIEGVEDRGWGTDGYVWTASFRDKSGSEFVRIGGWNGPNDDWTVYTAGALIVCPNPDRRSIHVRAATGQWMFFDLRLPGRSESLAEFSRFTPTLTEAELRRFQADLTDAEAGYSPSTEILAFDPETFEIRVRVLTTVTREAVFTLREDGQQVKLKSLRIVG